MVSKAKTLEDIRRVCRPMPLKGEELDVFFVETDEARDPYQNTRVRIAETLDSQEDARILFYGHRGCGKSTEINKLLSELGDKFLPVTFSVSDEMSPIAIRAEDLILVIAERVLNTAKRANLSVNDSLLAPVLDYFAQIVRTEKDSNDACGQIGAGVSSKSGLLSQLIGLFAEFRAEIKLNAHSDTTKIATLRKRPADLLVQANCVIEAVRDALPQGQRLLIVVEDLDKLDLKQAREIYVNNVNLLTGIRTNILYTIPVFLFHSPEVNAFKHNFDDVIALPMIKVFEPPAFRTPGFNTVRQLILKRLDENLIEQAALDTLVEKTGGVLRHAFEAMHTTALMAGAKVPLQKSHVEYGLNRLRKDFWQQITLPYDQMPGGPKTADELYDRLADYGRKQQSGKKILPMSDAINQILLKSCALVEYNGDGWFGVHPLVMENLKALGRLS